MRRLAPAAVICLAAISGCGPHEPKSPTHVRGQVTFQGKPLAGGWIVFCPDRERGHAGRATPARLDAEGRYQLAPGHGPTLAPGWYLIAFAEAAEATAPPFPPALRRPDCSGVTREVKAGKESVFDFDIAATP